MANTENFIDGMDSVNVLPNNKTYATSGGKYVRYSDDDATKIDPGYPALFGTNWGELPSNFVPGFDSMATLPNKKTYVTKGGEYIRYSDENANVIDPGYPAPFGTNWGDLPAAFRDGFDAMATLPNGKTYVLKNDQYIRYSDENANVIDPTYPRSIKGNWGDLPEGWDEGVDAVATLPNGKTYLLKGGEYVRYSDKDAVVIDPGYPRQIPQNWGFVEDV